MAAYRRTSVEVPPLVGVRGIEKLLDLQHARLPRVIVERLLLRNRHSPAQ
jgi:hypothetical protein